MPRKNVLRSQARQMVHDVLTFMKNEAQEGLQYDLKAVQKRTAAATGVSQRTVRRIAVAASVPGVSMRDVFKTPGKKRQGKRKVTAMSSTNLGLVKRCIHNYHITEKELPTVQNVLRKLRQEAGFQGQASSMRRILADLGFKWKRTEDNRKALIEHVSIRQKRIEYLQAIMNYRAEGRPIVFIDTSHVDIVHTTDSKRNERVIIIQAAGDTGFLDKTLHMFKSSSKCDDNKQYDRWIKLQLIPNLPENAVVVVGKTQYFHKADEAVPTSTSRRSFMEAWLIDKGIPFYASILKPQLYKLISTYKCGFRQYKIDGILNESNHPVMRIPNFHPDLNPFDEIWPLIKNHVNPRSVESAKKLIKERSKVINDEVGLLCKRIEEIEVEYSQSDAVIDAFTDEVTIHVSDDESEDSDEDSVTEDEQNESSSDEELVSKDAEVMEVNVSPESILT